LLFKVLYELAVPTMDSWAPTSTSIQSFAHLFSDVRLPSPPDKTDATTTKQPSYVEVEISGRSFHSLQRMDVSRLEISKEHTLEWACILLEEYGPYPQPGYEEFWVPTRVNHRAPGKIFSGNDVREYFQVSVLEPALSAAIFLHAEHVSLTASQSGGYPRYKWDVRSQSVSTRSGCAMLQIHFETCNEPIIIAEGRTSRACSIGDTADVIGKIPDWFEEVGDVILMDPPGSSPATRPAGSVNIYDAPWKHRLQGFFFQVCIPNTFVSSSG